MSARKVIEKPPPKEESALHPMESILRMERIPHIWCPTCGIGTTVTAFAAALEKLEWDLDKVCVVSGIGCTGRVAGYMRLDSFHTTHGRPIAFATGVKLGNPKLKVVVVSGDGDLIAIGGNHFIHAARRNIDLTVICVNNFIYAMTGGQVAPTTPITGYATTSPYGNFEKPFNIPHLAESCGAVYVARWTALHIRRLTASIAEALQKPGFSVVEVITPCSNYWGRINRLGTGLDLMKFYHDNAIIKHNEDTRNLDIEFKKPIVVGKFIDRDRPTFLDAYNKRLGGILGDEFKPYGGEA
ncbi:2-oxoacid:ferredoxin oxidoreductase subunit beta [Candidatus Zixiibacteriota bacterium]